VAGNQSVCLTTGHQNLRRQFHVATAAHSVIHAHHHILALVLDNRSYAHGGGSTALASSSRLLSAPRVFPELLLALAQLRHLIGHQFFASSDSRVNRVTSFCAPPRAHQFDLLILDLRDVPLQV